MERMIGCLVLWKCFVACLFFEESQQPTCPHSMHSRRCTQVSPILTQSWQTCTSVLLNLICFQCAQPVVMTPSHAAPAAASGRRHDNRLRTLEANQIQERSEEHTSELQ